ncbi:MAG: c-type cytochrome [Anaerolineales bacterium]|nr:c-type cytochrome [Anaerolineales bacterium]MCB9128425.1 c-type cytochrome [Ardenticatenales bacterium]
MKVEHFEKAFLSLGALLLLAGLGALLYGSIGAHIHLPGNVGQVDPAVVRTTAPFDQPGLRQVGPNEYEAVILGQTWNFLPSELRVPVGADVRFIGTSADVIHGLNIEGTRVNMMLIPGQISSMTYRFDEPGEHLIICHEYCGAAHHSMFGRVVAVNQLTEGDLVGSGSALAESGVYFDSEGNLVCEDIVGTGTELFQTQGCAGCHSLPSANASGNIGPPLDQVAANAAQRITDASYTSSAETPDDYIRESIMTPAAHVVDGYPNAMPAPQSLSDAEVEVLVQMLLAVSGQ